MGYATSKSFPIARFKWIDPKEFELNRCNSNSLKRCFLEINVEYPKESRGGYSFSKKSVKDLTRLAFSKADNGKKSFFKVIIYRETQMAWISIISLLLLVSWSPDQSKYTHIFHSKTQYLALMLQRHNKTSAFRLIYNII